MADQLHANTDPIEFDDATADALGSAMRSAASAIDGQAGSRQSCTGSVGSAGAGLITGAGGSVASSKFSASALSKLDIAPEIPAGWRPHLSAPDGPDARAVVTTGVDHLTSGLQSMINEAIRPLWEGPAAGLENGLSSGSEGPRKPLGDHAG